jgi:hypothetical protein
LNRSAAAAARRANWIELLDFGAGLLGFFFFWKLSTQTSVKQVTIQVPRSMLFFGSAAAPRPLFCFPQFFGRSPFFGFIAFVV